LSASQAFAAVLKEDKQHEWSQEDVDEAGQDLNKYKITSVYITPECNLRPKLRAKILAYNPTTEEATQLPATPQSQRQTTPMPPQPTPVLQPLATPFASATTPTLRQPIQSQPQGNPAQEPALQPPVSQPPAVPEATPIAPPVASVPAIAIGTAPLLLQPTATSFMPAIAANPMPPYQIQPQHPI
jgi:hypothetical protein